MNIIYWTIIEIVNNNHEQPFEHRVFYETNNLWGHENLPHNLPQNIMISSTSGSFQYIDKYRDLRQYTWRMEK